MQLEQNIINVFDGFTSQWGDFMWHDDVYFPSHSIRKWRIQTKVKSIQPICRGKSSFTKLTKHMDIFGGLIANKRVIYIYLILIYFSLCFVAYVPNHTLQYYFT